MLFGLIAGLLVNPKKRSVRRKTAGKKAVDLQ